MATYPPAEMFVHQPQQQQQQQSPPPPSQQMRMAYPLDLSLCNQLQYNGPSSPPAVSPTGELQVHDRVFVGSLQVEVTEEILKRVFEKVEPQFAIRDCKIIRESTGLSKGYGFVTYHNVQHAQEIIEKPQGTFVYKGRQWNISTAVRRYPPHASPSAVFCYPYSPMPMSSPMYNVNGELFPVYFFS